MILIGMLDSPYVRRVAVSLKYHGMEFEHANWSVGRDFELIREYNPLGRVPTLVLDDGDALVDSSAILDYLDNLAVHGRTLLPASGLERRRAQQLMAIATGAADKAVSQIYERAFRPAAKRHEPWVERCRVQVDGALRVLDDSCGAQFPDSWLIGAVLTQADITVACMYRFIEQALGLGSASYPALGSHSARCEALPNFASTQVEFSPPEAAP